MLAVVEESRRTLGSGRGMKYFLAEVIREESHCRNGTERCHAPSSKVDWCVMVVK